MRRCVTHREVGHAANRWLRLCGDASAGERVESPRLNRQHAGSSKGLRTPPRRAFSCRKAVMPAAEMVKLGA